MIWFSERKELEDKYYEWLMKDPLIADCPLNVIGFLCSIGRIKSKDECWISCDERLPSFSPNKWRKVLVTLEDSMGERFVTTAKYNEEYKE